MKPIILGAFVCCAIAVAVKGEAQNNWVWTSTGDISERENLYPRRPKTEPQGQQQQQQHISPTTPSYDSLEDTQQNQNILPNQQQQQNQNSAQDQDDGLTGQVDANGGIQVPSKDCIPVPDWLKQQINQFHMESTGQYFFKSTANVHGCIRPPAPLVGDSQHHDAFIANDCVNIILPEWLIAKLVMGQIDQSDGGLATANQGGPIVSPSTSNDRIENLPGLVNVDDSFGGSQTGLQGTHPGNQQGSQQSQQSNIQTQQQNQQVIVDDDFLQQQGSHQLIQPVYPESQSQGGFVPGKGQVIPGITSPIIDPVPVVDPVPTSTPADQQEPEEDFTCVGQELGYHADMRSGCRVYYKCIRGWDRPFVFWCPADLIFDERYGVCGLQEVSQCGRPTPPAQEDDGTKNRDLDLMGIGEEIEFYTTTKKPKFFRRIYNRFRDAFKPNTTPATGIPRYDNNN